MSNPSVLRRYTPPTCTLEILADQSPLSRWAGQTVLKNVRFRLKLDDPALPDTQQVTLSGDRAQLEALSDAVTTYIHTFLQQSEERLQWYFVPVISGLEASPTLTIADAEQVEPVDSSAVPPVSSSSVYLMPETALSHTLHFGSLATDRETTAMSLSTLQLFDLANALDDYAAEALSLPNLQRPKWFQAAPSWGAIAASALIAIGVSASLIKLMDGTYRSSTVTAASQGASSTDQRIATQLPPSVVQKTTPPIISTQPLPPLPTAIVPASPQAGLPTVPVNPTGSNASGSSSAPSIASRPIQQPGAITLNPSTVQIDAPKEKPTAPSAENGQSSADATMATAPSTTEGDVSPTDSGAGGEAADRSGAAALKVGPAAAARTASIDLTEQIAEARSFMEQRWKPPEGLEQSLQYSLVIDGKGSVKSIFPLGTAAGTYIDRTGLPLPGEPFIQGAAGGQSFNLRLVLEPDGKVQVLPE